MLLKCCTERDNVTLLTPPPAKFHSSCHNASTSRSINSSTTLYLPSSSTLKATVSVMGVIKNLNVKKLQILHIRSYFVIYNGYI